MASIVPTVAHLTKEDVEIDGYLIPKDTIVFSNLMRIHYDERYWEDPSAFNPERFYDKEAKKCKKYINLVPFGIGKRFCLGQPLAEKELFLFMILLKPLLLAYHPIVINARRIWFKTVTYNWTHTY